MDTEFDGGVYHGRIILPAEYPMKPPNIIILTVSQWSLIIVVCDVCILEICEMKNFVLGIFGFNR